MGSRFLIARGSLGAGPHLNPDLSRSAAYDSKPSMPNKVDSLRVLLEPAHPIRNDKHANQFLNRDAATLGEVFQTQEDVAIENLHELNGLLRITHYSRTSLLDRIEPSIHGSPTLSRK